MNPHIIAIHLKMTHECELLYFFSWEYGDTKMNTKILIVDDEIDIVLMLSSFFENKGYHVLSATNGEEALKQIE